MPIQWLKRLFGERDKDVIQIFTPRAAGARGTGAKIVLAGATVVGLATAGVVALGSFVLLLAALGVIYFLVTEVLGVRLDVDPRAFVERAQQYAQHSRN